MQREDRPLPMAEVSSALGCDVYELGRMILCVVDFLDLRPDFPEFDIVHSLERTIKNSPSFGSIERGVIERMQRQGVFLIQCAVKWFLSTGRRPISLVVAVLVFVAELNGVEAEGEGEYADAIASQVCCLANEVRQLASSRPITVLNVGGSGQSNLSSLVVLAAALGALGYGYMWWKGISFSYLMNVTKRNMEKTVTDLTKKLQHASDVIAASDVGSGASTPNNNIRRSSGVSNTHSAGLQTPPS